MKAQSLWLLLATLLCWIYGVYLYHSANLPLASKSVAQKSIKSNTPSKIHHDSGVVLDDSNDGILTFVHASDLHISKYVPMGGYIHFLHFLKTALPLISPRLLTVTGDLTDGKDSQKLRSMQQIDEWEAYEGLLKQFDLVNRFDGTFYRDQRGNHDCFDVYSFESAGNYYKNYSAVRDPGYFLKLNESFGTYSFIATDGCPKHGFARPLNFFGYLDAQRMNQLEEHMELAAGSNHTFLLNHYPVSTMLYGKHKSSFNDLVRSVSIFLCGHLHQLVGGLGAQLQAYKAEEGYWELEIGDMKEHAIYRVYAVDHDIISFVDVTLPFSEIPLPNPDLLNATVDSTIPHPPVVLITNPKDSHYIIPQHEPLERILTSKFIRILVWADSPVDTVTISIDGVHHGVAKYNGKEANGIKTPLWVSPWDPSLYHDSRMHTMTVVAVDSQNKTTEQTVQFRFGTDPISLHNDGKGGWIMQQNFPNIFRASGLISYLALAIFLVVLPRIFLNSLHDPAEWFKQRAIKHHIDEARLSQLTASFIRGHITNPLLIIKLVLSIVVLWFKMLFTTQITAQVSYVSVSWLFWPSYAFTMAITVLPLFMGQLIPSSSSDGVGSVYIYGVYVAGEWVPLTDSWTYGLLSIATLWVLLLYLPIAATPTSMFYLQSPGQQRSWRRSRIVRLLVAIFTIAYLVLPSLMTVYAYGFISLFLGFSKSWTTIAAIISLYYFDWHPRSDRAARYTQVPHSSQS